MSKSDGWEKVNAHEWRKRGDKFFAQIVKLTGTYGVPFAWDVYPLPRKDNLDAQGRYRATAMGSEKTLAEAKANAQSVVDRLVALDERDD